MRLKIACGRVLFLNKLISPLNIRRFHIKKKSGFLTFFGKSKGPTQTAAGNRKTELRGQCSSLPRGSCHNPNMIKDPLPLPLWATAQLHKTLTRHAVPSFGSMLTWLPSSWDASIRCASLMGIGKQSFRIQFKCPWLHETNSGISGKTNQALFEALEHFLVLGLSNLFSHVHSQCWAPSEKLIMLWSFLKTKI